MSVTYFVALPFVRTEEGIAPGQAQEMPNEVAAIRRAEVMSRDPANAGALAFKRTGDPNMGNFGDATVLRTMSALPRKPTSHCIAAKCRDGPIAAVNPASFNGASTQCRCSWCMSGV